MQEGLMWNIQVNLINIYHRQFIRIKNLMWLWIKLEI